jgi:putative phosphoribosyl transferase
MQRIFKNRQQAGEKLGSWLSSRYRNQDPLVLGIPRGGVEVAYHVSKKLNAELSLVVAKKLPFPGHEEYGFGAIAEDNIVYITPHGMTALKPEEINRIIVLQKREVQRRILAYRHGNPLPAMKGRKVILVDDGIATGATLVPVIRLCRQKEVDRVVIAAPVSGTSFDMHLHEADDIEVLLQPKDFYAVGQAYETFGDFPDAQVSVLLEKAEQERNRQLSGPET